MDENEIREALQRHRTASDRNDFEIEHDFYRDDALLAYPQSGERIEGRATSEHRVSHSRTRVP